MRLRAYRRVSPVHGVLLGPDVGAGEYSAGVPSSDSADARGTGHDHRRGWLGSVSHATMHDGQGSATAVTVAIAGRIRIPAGERRHRARGAFHCAAVQGDPGKFVSCAERTGAREIARQPALRIAVKRTRIDEPELRVGRRDRVHDSECAVGASAILIGVWQRAYGPSSAKVMLYRHRHVFRRHEHRHRRSGGGSEIIA